MNLRSILAVRARSAEVFKQVSNNELKCFKKKILPGKEVLPYVNFLTEISPGPALAVFAFRASPVRLALKQKHRSGLQVPYAGKAVCLLPDRN